MKAIRKEPGKFPEVVEIPNTLEALQKAVGGYIEVWPVTTDLAILCDEEGKLKGAEDNCTLLGEDFVGTILLVGLDGPEFCDVDPHVADLFKMLWEM